MNFPEVELEWIGEEEFGLTTASGSGLEARECLKMVEDSA